MKPVPLYSSKHKLTGSLGAEKNFHAIALYFSTCN